VRALCGAFFSLARISPPLAPLFFGLIQGARKKRERKTYCSVESESESESEREREREGGRGRREEGGGSAQW